MRSATTIILVLALVLLSKSAFCQDPVDKEKSSDPIYERPFITSFGNGQTAIGGYAEGNTNYFSEEGVSEGFSMEFRRFNIFLYSTVGQRISFFSELEFEHGTEEIKLETALVDFELNPSLILRGGIILPPIGMFNQNHDSPKWDFIDRPLVSTSIIPTTLSEVGFGVLGRLSSSAVSTSYQLYLTNGIGAGVISNDVGRTSIPMGRSEEAFAEDNNGVPSLTGRVGFSKASMGELGLSFYTGIYNSFRIEGDDVDERRRLSLLAIDFDTAILSAALRGEVVVAILNVDESAGQFFGDRQRGGFVELVVPVVKKPLLGFNDASVNVTSRFEYVDYNVGTFDETDLNIGDDVRAIVLGASFRASSEFVFKANYRYHWINDILGNPARLGGFQLGFATYF